MAKHHSSWPSCWVADGFRSEVRQGVLKGEILSIKTRDFEHVGWDSVILPREKWDFTHGIFLKKWDSAHFTKEKS